MNEDDVKRIAAWISEQLDDMIELIAENKRLREALGEILMTDALNPIYSIAKAALNPAAPANS